MIRGTNHEQDARFQDKTKRMLQKSNWPEKYDIKIDLKKVDYELIKIWIEKKITLLLGEQDDIISGTLISHIDEHIQKQQKLNAKKLHIAISGFLQQKTLTFMSQFWDILDEAQRSSRGIPECLIEEKKMSQQVHRKKLDEMNLKRHKINTNYFNNLVKPISSSKGKYDYRKEEEQKVKQANETEHKKTKRHHKDRSRSKTKHKKHRSRSHQKNKRQRSRQREVRKGKERKRHSSSQYQEVARPKHKKGQKRRRSQESDSSGVVSSSDSES